MPKPGSTEWKHCAIEDCSNKVKDHAWGHIQAEGWFFQRDGTSYCPDHIPDWVEGWRASQATKKIPEG